jgi:aryl-alcohol dehydrogenase-like predicted oxidoreductase
MRTHDAPLPRRWLGRTGIEVSAVGLGAGPLGDALLSDERAERVVRTAIDLGISVVDTAPSYGLSEERVGRAIRGVRDRVTLVTKVGYGVPGETDWTPGCVEKGLEQALGRLGTDRIDVVLLHSCAIEKLVANDLFEPLRRAKERGLVRAVGYSGDGDALAWAIRSGEVDVVECSVNLFDQAALAHSIPEARERGLGVLAKRSLGNAVWTSTERPARHDTAVYWDRMRAMSLPDLGRPLDEVALRFAAFAPGVDCALVGTSRTDHLERAAVVASCGPLSHPVAVTVQHAFAGHGRAWDGLV